MSNPTFPVRTAQDLPDAGELLAMYRRMVLIRTFENTAARLYRQSEIPGFVHLSTGQEAVAVGACGSLAEDDIITSTHRGHGHCLAKGLDPTSMLAELMGRDTGTCRGRGGSMHIANPDLGIFGANGIVGAGLPIAVGAATAIDLRSGDQIVVSFFGDGAVAQGMFHESVTLAASWHLPVLFLCENNHFAEFSADADASRLAAKAAGYGIRFAHVDGNDVAEVARTVRTLAGDIRAGGGPVLLEAETYRWSGHYEGDPQKYRPEGELAAWQQRDPLLITRAQLRARGVEPDVIDAVSRDVDSEITAAVDAARSAPLPAPDALFDFVFSPRADVREPAPPTGEVFRTMDAIRSALRYELQTDQRVFLAGVDVGAGGNVFGLTRGLAAEFPRRVRDTPILETAIIGTAVGASLAGMRPVVEIMYMDFLGVCLDQLMNQAAKLRFMTGGRASLPMVVRTQIGAGRSSGSQHSQSLEAILAHIPGLTVVMPSNPAETYGLLRAAIQDPNPVIFVENRLQYGMKGPRPAEDYLIPIGKARVVREGTDVTLVSWSRMAVEAEAAAAMLSAEGISVEVIDLRTIVPLDRDTVLASLAKTGRLVIAHEAVRDFGVGAELAALAATDGFWQLDGPVERVGAEFMPAPYSPALEKLWLPDRGRIADAVRRADASRGRAAGPRSRR